MDRNANSMDLRATKMDRNPAPIDVRATKIDESAAPIDPRRTKVDRPAAHVDRRRKKNAKSPAHRMAAMGRKMTDVTRMSPFPASIAHWENVMLLRGICGRTPGTSPTYALRRRPGLGCYVARRAL
jgi:hypothetical protein